MKIRFISISLILILLPAADARAQLINYDRKKSEASSTALGAQSQTPAVEVSPSRWQNLVESKLKAQLAVDNRIERIYDINDDGRMQEDEVKDFLRDVIASIEKQGRFSASSAILKDFDVNQDGQITLKEADNFKPYIN